MVCSSSEKFVTYIPLLMFFFLSVLLKQKTWLKVKIRTIIKMGGVTRAEIMQTQKDLRQLLFVKSKTKEFVSITEEYYD